MLDLSVIIVNWNAKDLLRKCLEHVQTTVQSTQYEIIVVDNYSTDDSQTMVKHDFPDVKLIENTKNVGFAGANNQGMREAAGRYFLLLNSDAFVEPNTIDTMVQFMDDHPEAGMSACKLLYNDRSLQPSAFAYPTLKTELYTALQLNRFFPKSHEFGKQAMTYWDFNDVRAVDAVMGAFMLVRREVVDQVGMMDESYFMYSEEIDWCYRIHQHGWQILYNPEVQTVHLWGGTSQQIRTEMFLQLYRSKVQYFRKNYGAISARALKWIIGFGCLLRIGPGMIYYLRAASPEQREKHRAFRQLLLDLPAY